MTLTGYIVGTKGNTGRGIASIVENADYTITINLTDGSSYTTAPIAGFTAVDFDENYDLVVTKTDGTTETVETDIEAFRTVLAGYKSDAETAESNASGYATAASGSASTATSQATLAKSYAKGGTSSRTGEDTDNADYYRGLAAASATAAGTSESNAGTHALKSEGYAVGKQNGTDVSSGSDYYHNNAKYYSDMAHIDATDASDSQSSASGSASTASAQALKSEGYAVGKQNGTDVTSGSDYYQNNSKYYKEQAATGASSASTNALKAEGFAVGEQNGTAVSSGSPYYENNAEYYAGEAADSATAAAASAASLVIEDALDEDSTNALENGVIAKEFATKANIDGAYEAMTVGNAEQLVSTVFVNDEEPYNFRTSGGSADIGDREYDTIVGGTVAWNQLIKNGDFATDSNWSTNNATKTISDGVYTFTASGTNGYICTNNPSRIFPSTVNNHKYLCSARIKLSTATTEVKLLLNGGYKTKSCVATTSWQEVATIYNLSNSDNGMVQIIDTRASGFDAIQVDDVMVVDLTQMFGTTIADYIYSLETANAGAGVAWFRKLFPKPYYAYNAGELMSVNTSAHNTVRFNQWDEESESGYYDIADGTAKTNASWGRSKNPIKCLPNTTYCISQQNGVDGSIGYILFYGANDNYIGSQQMYSAMYGSTGQTFTTPSDCCSMRFYTSRNNSLKPICINLSWDGERDGEYEEYVKHSYPLDSDLTLRGIPKLDASNNLYYDGDVYESDGSVTRKFATNNASNITWATRYTGTTKEIVSGNIGDMYAVSDPCIMMEKYPYISAIAGASVFSNPDEAEYGCYSYSLGAQDYSLYVVLPKDETPSGNLIFKLATPTTETADPFQSPQIVDDFGTEEYVVTEQSGVAVPVGHITKYTNNLRAKLEMSPNSPDGAGDYLVRQTNGINEYVQFVPELPTKPSTNGTYVLKATVSGGVATLSWEEES